MASNISAMRMIIMHDPQCTKSCSARVSPSTGTPTCTWDGVRQASVAAVCAMPPDVLWATACGPLLPQHVCTWHRRQAGAQSTTTANVPWPCACGKHHTTDDRRRQVGDQPCARECPTPTLCVWRLQAGRACGPRPLGLGPQHVPALGSPNPGWASLSMIMCSRRSTPMPTTDMVLCPVAGWACVTKPPCPCR